MDVMIFGAGGHCKVIIDLMNKLAGYHVVGLYDYKLPLGTIRHGYPIIANEGKYEMIRNIHHGIIAIGDNWVRSQMVRFVKAINTDISFVTLVHPFTSIAENVMIGAGSVLMAGAVVQAGTYIGQHTIINTGASIDHDSRIEDYASIAPGATLGGNVSIGAYTAIGLGAHVIQKVAIGSHTVIGAGATVLGDVEAGIVAYGTPCKAIKSREVGDDYLS